MIQNQVCLIAIFASLLFSCCEEPFLKDSAKYEIQKLRILNKCYAIHPGLVEIGSGDKKKNLIMLEFTGCGEKLNYDSIESQRSFTDSVAREFYNLTLDKKKYIGIMIIYKLTDDESHTKTYTYYSIKDSLILKDSYRSEPWFSE